MLRLQPASQIITLCLFLGLSGCTISPLRFQARDAETGQPLSDVILTQYGTPNTIELWPNQGFEISYPPSDAKGIVTTLRVDPYHYYNGFAFRKPGYLKSAAGFVQYKLEIAVYPASPEAAFGGKPTNSTTDLKDLIIIPMYRLGSPNAPKYELLSH